MSDELTPWFPRQAKPHRPGVYKTQHGFQHWNGHEWGLYTMTAVRAAHLSNSGYRSIYQSVSWRGLAKAPK